MSCVTPRLHLGTAHPPELQNATYLFTSIELYRREHRIEWMRIAEATVIATPRTSRVITTRKAVSLMFNVYSVIVHDPLPFRCLTSIVGCAVETKMTLPLISIFSERLPSSSLSVLRPLGAAQISYLYSNELASLPAGLFDGNDGLRTM